MYARGPLPFRRLQTIYQCLLSHLSDSKIFLKVELLSFIVDELKDQFNRERISQEAEQEQGQGAEKRLSSGSDASDGMRDTSRNSEDEHLYFASRSEGPTKHPHRRLATLFSDSGLSLFDKLVDETT